MALSRLYSKLAGISYLKKHSQRYGAKLSSSTNPTMFLFPLHSFDAKPNKGNNTDALVYIQPETKKYRSSYQAIIPVNNDEAQERVILAVMAVCLSDIFVSTHSEKYIAAVNSMNNRTAMGQGGPDKLPNLLVYRRQKNYSNNPAENPLHKVYQMYRPLAPFFTF